MVIGGELPPSPDFPRLRPENHRITSERSDVYNCIARAADDVTRWWWPDSEDLGVAYWPEGTPRREQLDAFIAAFAALGYGPADDADPESGLEKVALFARDGTPTHAARQLADGPWSSKLGREYDVAHTLDALEGPSYGVLCVILARGSRHGVGTAGGGGL